MSDVAADGLIPRGEVAKEEELHKRTVRGFERDRRIMRLAAFVGPWAVSVLLLGLVASDRYERAHHPMPSPEIRVAAIGAGMIVPATPVDELMPDQAAAALNNTIAAYVFDRESYCWTCRNRIWQHVMAVSDPKEAARFKERWDNKADPDNPENLYGTGLRAGYAEVDPFSIRVTEDKNSPNYFTAVFRVRLVAPDGKERTITKVATMQWLPAGASMSPEVKQAYSPLGLGCWAYNSYPVKG